MENTQNSSNFYRMQKLAGLITEEEYNTQMWYNKYSENLNKNIKDLKQLLLKKGYDLK
jgi:G:T-mismatch repair DNA endonuclease (very short patch repair protein)